MDLFGSIIIDSVSSQPELYNNSFRDVISVKISQEALITYSFQANATIKDSSSFNPGMYLTISAGNHLVSLILVTGNSSGTDKTALIKFRKVHFARIIIL